MSLQTLCMTLFAFVIINPALATGQEEAETNVTVTYLNAYNKRVKEERTYSLKKSEALGYYIRNISYDKLGRETVYEEYYTNKESLKSGISRSVFHLDKKGKKVKVEHYFTQTKFLNSGINKIITSLDKNGLREKIEYYYAFSPNSAKKFTFYKIVARYHRDGHKISEEKFNTELYTKETGVFKSIIYFNRSEKKETEELYMSPAQIRKKDIVKTIYYFNAYEKEENKQGIVLSRKKSKELGYVKAILYFDRNGNKLKEERFYIANNMNSEGYHKGIIFYAPSGEKIAEQRYDEFGNNF